MRLQPLHHRAPVVAHDGQQQQHSPWPGESATIRRLPGASGPVFSDTNRVNWNGLTHGKRRAWRRTLRGETRSEHQSSSRSAKSTRRDAGTGFPPDAAACEGTSRSPSVTMRSNQGEVRRRTVVDRPFLANPNLREHANRSGNFLVVENGLSCGVLIRPARIGEGCGEFWGASQTPKSGQGDSRE